MRLLLDTHSLLWYLTSDPRLSKKAATVLADPETEAFVSAATLWEIVIKASLGSLSWPRLSKNCSQRSWKATTSSSCRLKFGTCSAWVSCPFITEIRSIGC
jgi:PIN domain nuclease of toxin-antitoxin system